MIPIRRSYRFGSYVPPVSGVDIAVMWVFAIVAISMVLLLFIGIPSEIYAENEGWCGLSNSTNSPAYCMSAFWQHVWMAVSP